jgi:hypothetical protein
MTVGFKQPPVIVDLKIKQLSICKVYEVLKG